jgi:hypothetical protein
LKEAERIVFALLGNGCRVVAAALKDQAIFVDALLV